MSLEDLKLLRVLVGLARGLGVLSAAQMMLLLILQKIRNRK